MLLSACSYKPPYQRGYDEGYAAGVAASGGSVSSDGAEENGAQDNAKGKISHTLSLSAEDDDEKGDQTDDVTEGTSTADNAAGDAAGTGADDTAETVTAESAPGAAEVSENGTEGSDSEVLGEGSEPAEGGSGIPSGRIIAAEAVNEALFSNPEVIDGLRQIYPDNAIFGEYVGDSETNLLHKVGSQHFNELGYDTIVVFDDSKSLQDILDEGFFTKCECMD
ncbi:MAG: hypothetical protein K6G42_05755 [Lachnospiraceae bacterium]|nr:hypothetical protein [Lachnospiraceae bacterium]